MQIILLETMPKLGKLGEEINVKAGYARNFLLPFQKAISANRENRAFFESRRHELEAKEAGLLEKAKVRAQSFEGVLLTIEAHVADGGKLYGSIGLREIIESANKLGIELNKNEIQLPTGPLRQIGEHIISVHLHSNIVFDVKVNIVSQNT